MAGGLLLAQGLHLRVPDRDRRIRRAPAQLRRGRSGRGGVSIDSEYVHLAWRGNHPDLRHLPFPMAADVKRELTGALGILDPDEGVALRATFIVDPEGIIRFVSVNDLDTGRNVDEVLRSLTAIQAGGLTSCGWRVGDATLDAA